MVHQCANPGCAAQLHYLRSGKLFVVDRRKSESQVAGGQLPVEHFWICETCAATHTMCSVNGHPLCVRLDVGSALAAAVRETEYHGHACDWAQQEGRGRSRAFGFFHDENF